MLKNILKFIFLFSVSIFLISWGSDGHYTINYKCTESFPVSMNSFLVWADSLASHGSDADDRKSWDPNESMRHYIDIDSYPEFISTGAIDSNYNANVSLHGLNFVENNGTLPWATVIMYDSLRMAFQQQDWREAMLHASDLGHYVGDAHQPLHLTENYNGQMTGQTGVHSRYESDMVYYFLNYIATYTGDTVHLVSNVNQYVFDYIYYNQHYVDSVLAADTYAQTLVGNDNTYAYYQALYSKAGNFTNLLWHNASHALAELIYTAWYEAGSPPLTSAINELQENTTTASVTPNPVTENSILNFNLPSSSEVKFSVFDCSGKLISENENYFLSGKNKIAIESAILVPGIYFIKVDDGNTTEIVRFLKP